MKRQGFAIPSSLPPHSVQVRCWGQCASNTCGYSGPVNIGTASLPVAEAGVVNLGNNTVRAVYAGYDHTAAVLTSGVLVAWGSNLYGELGAFVDSVAPGGVYQHWSFSILSAYSLQALVLQAHTSRSHYFRIHRVSYQDLQTALLIRCALDPTIAASCGTMAWCPVQAVL